MTKYVPASDTRGSRIKATTGQGHSVSVPYRYEGDAYDAHKHAAESLMRKLGWTGRIIGGGYGSAYFWVFASGSERDARSRRAGRRR